MNRIRARWRLSALLLPLVALAAGSALADAPINAVPPAEPRPAAAAEKAAPVQMALPVGAPTLRLGLSALTETERAALRARNARGGKTQKAAATRGKGAQLAVGVGRALPTGSQSITLDALAWQTLPDGTRAARLEVASTGAAALRVALTLAQADPDLSVRFSGNATGAQVFGPIPANVIAEDTARFGEYWSPILEGDVARIEFEARPGVKVEGLALGIPRLSHQLLAGGALARPDAKAVAEIGDALPCETDVKCVVPQTTALVNAAKAAAQIVFTDEFGFSYLCSGTLINDATASGAPYFYTANHCIDSATAARTINTYWFFDAVACGSLAVPPYVQQASGAALLARSPDWDWALVRLNAPPPAGASYSAWRAEPVAPGTALAVLHHPAGDLKKYSQGNALGFVPDSLYDFPTPATFVRMTYTQGQTEGGSSGAGILSLAPSGTFYELRGGLYGGDNPACPRPAGYTDDYSRLDKMLPLTRQYLTPGNNPTGAVVVVEFYNQTLQHYFMSADPDEINKLDTGVFIGWERTGLRFLAYASSVAGTNPVCRFYRAPGYGDSHFYSASPAECAATAAAHPVDWIYESPNVFYIPLPDQANGACPVGTAPLWRFFNQVTTNHRYTGDVKTRDEMRADPVTWIPEGYGTDAVIMCAPAGS